MNLFGITLPAQELLSLIGRIDQVASSTGLTED